MEVGGKLYAPAALPLRKTPGILCTGGWVGAKVGGDGCETSCPHRDLIPEPSIY